MDESSTINTIEWPGDDPSYRGEPYAVIAVHDDHTIRRAFYYDGDRYACQQLMKQMIASDPHPSLHVHSINIHQRYMIPVLDIKTYDEDGHLLGEYYSDTFDQDCISDQERVELIKVWMYRDDFEALPEFEGF